jgi:hypothetical protein
MDYLSGEDGAFYPGGRFLSRRPENLSHRRGAEIAEKINY